MDSWRWVSYDLDIYHSDSIAGNRVQWFHAEAEMLWWQEHYEIKQAEFLRVLQSFTAQKNAWLKAAEMIHSNISSKPGYVTYAWEQAAMLDDMTERTWQCFMKAGYAHVLNQPEGELFEVLRQGN